MKYWFNGFLEEIPANELTIQNLLDNMQEDDPAVIVEVNGKYINRKEFDAIKIQENDRIEFIHPSFGG